MNLIKKLAVKSFLPIKILKLRHDIATFFGQDTYVIYTMGKVGSTSVFDAIKNQFMFPLVYHVHHLTDDSFNKTVKRYVETGYNIDRKVTCQRYLKSLDC
jgi:hypothetical protein